MQLSFIFAAALAVFTSSVIAAPQADTDICLKICYADKPDCTAPSYAKQTGDCWTCCTPSA
ncbi:hypothetical protein FE257_001917 [Aspergillus nanangensis]|uniref:Uncharacterized protein n=1 Tax=Aspergillus nanangensis TaxID=2582783 RepID=A0AAD4CDH6_ASPNN|nr:hypothetical protein FE257_001917 [Aspergillus nanangensis]